MEYDVKNFASKIISNTSALVDFAKETGMAEEEWFKDFQKQMKQMFECELSIGPCNKCPYCPKTISITPIQDPITYPQIWYQTETC